MSEPMRIDVLDVVSVVKGDLSVTGQELGGRRAQVALVALALAHEQVSGDRLASILWGDDLPATWRTALRGVVRGLRSACAPVGGGEQRLIATAPGGYRLAAGVAVDVDLAAGALDQARDLIEAGRYQTAITLAEPVARMAGSQLLPAEDAVWIHPHRQAVDALSMRAVELFVAAAGASGEHDRAIAAARRAVSTDPLDERAHRALIGALDRAGDRAGAVRAFEQCRAVLGDELGIDPSTQTVEAYVTALGEPANWSAARLPSIPSTFVGREQELARLGAAVASPGLVTVTGRGGVGKSRLAMRAAALGAFDGGRLWVSLAPVPQDTLVAATVALDVGVAIGADDAGAALAEHFAPLSRVVLVLDGCEVVVDGVASLAAELLGACPYLTLVVTSRLPLAIDGERIVEVGPLPPPASDDAHALLANTQVQLVLDRVREGGGALSVDDRLAPHLAALVRRCGGLPLALELVAAQLAAMSPGDLLDHLNEVVIEGDDQLRAVARSSYDLLDADEATVFRRLAVLDGAVGLGLVRQVVAGGPIAEIRVVRILRELTARGLLAVDRSGPRWRYQQDDDLHRYARELLVQQGEERETFDRLAEMVRAALPDDARAAPGSFQNQISDMLGSVRSLFGAALDGRADAGRCLELAFRLHRYFAATNVAEGRFWLGRLLAAEPQHAWTPYATYALGYLSYWSGDTMNAVQQLQTAVDRFVGVEDSYAARALIYLAGLLDDLDRGDEAIECVRRAIAAAAPFGIDLQVSAAMGMGSVLAERGDPAAAGYARDAIELCRRGGSAEQLAAALPTAAMVCWQVGAHEQCRAYIEEARPMHVDGRRIARVVLLSAAAGLALSDGDLDAAVDYGTQADAEASELGVEREAPLIRAVLARARLGQGDTGAAAVQALAAFDAAEATAVSFPVAICLETASLVASAAGTATDTELAGLLATAARLREQGNRLPSPSLPGAIDAVRAFVGQGSPLDLDDAVRLARNLLSKVAVPV
ncbi:MAG: BTAD domain-containing putative transcriptional regulator [Acidimicrobiales bacterium]